MKVVNLISIALAVIMLNGCGVTKKTLGFSRQGPDASAVKTNEPLILPPEYNVRPQKHNTEINQDDTSFEE